MCLAAPRSAVSMSRKSASSEEPLSRDPLAAKARPLRGAARAYCARRLPARPVMSPTGAAVSPASALGAGAAVPGTEPVAERLGDFLGLWLEIFGKHIETPSDAADEQPYNHEETEQCRHRAPALLTVF